jgi:hypothetical protein
MENENDDLRNVIASDLVAAINMRALLGEMADWRKGDANRQRQLDLLHETMKDFLEMYKRLHGGLVAMQNAVEAMGTRRN